MCAAIRKAVIPAAGVGTRFLPVTRSVPKELLPILDRPMLQYVVEEAAEAGITDVIVVTSPGKEGIAEYFRPRPDLEDRLAGDSALLEKARSGANLASVSFAIQEEPLGLGHAVLVAREAVGNEPFAVILPDDIVDHSPGVLSQMMAAVDGEDGAAAVAVERVPWELVQNYGVVDSEPSGEGRHRVRGLVEKPPPGAAPSNLSIVGRYLLPPQIFDCLERTPPGARGEIQLTDGLALLMENAAVYACEFEGIRYDGGNPMGLLRASLEYALKRDETRQAATELVRRLAADL
jgi:UTP--glucose-1-phosphate uridylyltransferase